MGLTKQARVLTDKQVKLCLSHLSTTLHSKRNKVIFLLSLRAGFRAKEISSVRWEMALDEEGNIGREIRLTNKASKGTSGGVIALSNDLREALVELATWQGTQGTIVKTSRGRQMSAQVITNWFFTFYRDLGFEGYSSHSGRRTAITRWAKNISVAGGSMRDVQALARHSSLALTQRYIETDTEAQRAVVNL